MEQNSRPHLDWRTSYYPPIKSSGKIVNEALNVDFVLREVRLVRRDFGIWFSRKMSLGMLRERRRPRRYR